jgi:hypothetical protein
MDLVKFINAHGGKLGGFRSYQVRSPAPPPDARPATASPPTPSSAAMSRSRRWMQATGARAGRRWSLALRAARVERRVFAVLTRPGLSADLRVTDVAEVVHVDTSGPTDAFPARFPLDKRDKQVDHAYHDSSDEGPIRSRQRLLLVRHQVSPGCTSSVYHAARCTASHGVGSHAEQPVNVAQQALDAQPVVPEAGGAHRPFGPRSKNRTTEARITAISSPSEALTITSRTRSQPDSFWVSAKSGVAVPAAKTMTKMTSPRVSSGRLLAGRQ